MLCFDNTYYLLQSKFRNRISLMSIGRLSFQHLSSKLYNVHILKVCTRWLSLQTYRYMQLDLQRKTTHALLQCKQRCVIAVLELCFHLLVCCSVKDSMLCNNEVPSSKKNVLPQNKFKYRY